MNRPTYAAVVDALHGGGAIERYQYTVGIRSFGYRLAGRFVTDKHVRVPATDFGLIRRWEKVYRQAAGERDGRMLPVHDALKELQERLEIHGAEARMILGTLPPECNPFDVQGIQIAEIEDRRFHHCNVGKTGRFSNNITCTQTRIGPSVFMSTANHSQALTCQLRLNQHCWQRS